MTKWLTISNWIKCLQIYEKLDREHSYGVVSNELPEFLSWPCFLEQGITKYGNGINE